MHYEKIVRFLKKKQNDYNFKSEVVKRTLLLHPESDIS